MAGTSLTDAHPRPRRPAGAFPHVRAAVRREGARDGRRDSPIGDRGYGHVWPTRGMGVLGASARADARVRAPSCSCWYWSPRSAPLARTDEPRERGRPWAAREPRTRRARTRPSAAQHAARNVGLPPAAGARRRIGPRAPRPPAAEGACGPVASPAPSWCPRPGAAQEHQAEQGHTRGTTGAQQGRPTPNRNTEPPPNLTPPTDRHRLPETSPEPTGRRQGATTPTDSHRPQHERTSNDAQPRTASRARHRAGASAVPAPSRATITAPIDFHRLAPRCVRPP